MGPDGAPTLLRGVLPIRFLLRPCGVPESGRAGMPVPRGGRGGSGDPRARARSTIGTTRAWTRLLSHAGPGPLGRGCVGPERQPRPPGAGGPPVRTHKRRLHGARAPGRGRRGAVGALLARWRRIRTLSGAETVPAGVVWPVPCSLLHRSHRCCRGRRCRQLWGPVFSLLVVGGWIAAAVYMILNPEVVGEARGHLGHGSVDALTLGCRAASTNWSRTSCARYPGTPSTASPCGTWRGVTGASPSTVWG